MGNTAIIEALRQYFSTQPVLKAWLFGSFSRGEETQDSDVDILISLDKSKPIGLNVGGFGRTIGQKSRFGIRRHLAPFCQRISRT